MSRILAFIICISAALGLLSGCGGFSSDGGNSLASFAGSYSASYTRSTGNMTIAVAANGQITITIVDAVEGTFVGTGIANHVGGFYITCNGVTNKQVTVNGTLKGTGLGRTAQGTVAGAISVSYNASLLSNPDTTVYTNHYEGAYAQGANSDNWFGDVASNGQFTGTLLVTALDAQVPITGSVYSNGSFKFTGKNGGTA